MSVRSIEGGCFCKAVRYRLAGMPSGSMICHCQSCRRVIGAPVVAWLSVAKRDLQMLTGVPTTFATSPPVCRSFCANCGTPLFYTHASEPDLIDVATCTLDDPNAFPPTHHSWLSHDTVWVKFGDGLPTYPKSRNADND
jgi:hypothetical protein